MAISWRRQTGDVESPVTTDEWKPDHEDFEYTDDFVKWVNSINSGWQHRIKYLPFELYCLQAEQWLADKTTILDYDNAEDQRYWLQEEVDKIKDNSLFFCNKYGMIKEDRENTGMLSYQAWDAQKVLLFLYDCGYSAMIGKARQIGFTTTMCLAGMKRVNFFKSYFIKFVTHSESKGKEIFKDKVKWAHTKLPDHLSEEVKNWTDLVMALDRTEGKKGREKGQGSRFQVDSPKIDAINGGSPSCVFVDEIGLFEIFGDMMREGRPALFKFNPEKGKLVQQQQFFAWGTGGEMEKGGAVFESEFKNALKQWNEKNYEYGIIPLFFNAYARPGVDTKYLEKEKKAYVDKQSSKKAELAEVQFYQAYPIIIEHMFIRKARTMVPITYSAKREVEIYSMDPPVQYGYYEPVYDMSQPTPDLFVPYRIIGATFVETMDIGDLYTKCCIVHHPPAGEKWKHRYYQGTDPINSETGHSKMSACVWDSLTNTVAAMIFYRTKNFKEDYLQCLLQRIYYDQNNDGGIPELIENNIGDMYEDFQKMHKYKRNIVANTRLEPEYFRKPNGKWFGISNKADTAPRIIAKMEEVFESYGDGINVVWIWEQLKTFVEKDLASTNTHRQTRYQAADTRYNYDDCLFSLVFAYINAVSHAKLEPVNMANADNGKKILTRYVQNHETNYRQRLAQVDEIGKVLKYIN